MGCSIIRSLAPLHISNLNPIELLFTLEDIFERPSLSLENIEDCITANVVTELSKMTITTVLIQPIYFRPTRVMVNRETTSIESSGPRLPLRIIAHIPKTLARRLTTSRIGCLRGFIVIIDIITVALNIARLVP
tara:strand:+ start:22253 stop:22654 length:402 start_codon:yes stop_codon:yes gene_type:complete